MGLLSGLAIAAGAAGAAGGLLIFAPIAIATIGYPAAVALTSVIQTGVATGTAAAAGKQTKMLLPGPLFKANVRYSGCECGGSPSGGFCDGALLGSRQLNLYRYCSRVARMI
ncbi:uncharacterized protein LOC144089622 isoform X1 [Stigmatopora argus]